MEKGIHEKPKIFITPWIDLGAEDIDKCIKAGAYSARIHTGKTESGKNIELIKYYNSRKFKFYLDLRGNKPSVDYIDEGLQTEMVNIGEKVWLYEDLKYKNYGIFDHYLKLSFFPIALRELKKEWGNITVDDGQVLFDIKRIVRNGDKIIGFETEVIRAKPVWYGDGVSSTNLFIHSGAKEPFSKVDIKILTAIPKSIRAEIYFVAISFCENSQNITDAKSVLKKLGFSNAQVVPKVETVLGIKNIKEICKCLNMLYGKDAELQIGRSDLTLDCNRLKKYQDPNKLVDIAIKICERNKVKISILAMIMHSVRARHKAESESVNWEPSTAELEYIRHLYAMNVYQIGLTNDMYINRPEKMVEKLANIVNNYNL